jgi:predicted anti-sigma-YlaC factor YlaD
MAFNLWWDHIIEAYLRACAEGRDWHEAVAEAEAAHGDAPRKALTQKDLKSKGLPYSRQHIDRNVRSGRFPQPFQLPMRGPEPEP